MGSIRDEFYRAIGKDYHRRQKESFLYSYIKQEKEGHFRLQLKRKYAGLKDGSISRGEYADFLVKALLTDIKLQKQYGCLTSLAPFLKAICGDRMQEAGGKVNIAALKDTLKKAEQLLRQEKFFDVETELLDHFTQELFGCYEFGTERKDIYVQLTEQYLSYGSGELDGNQYLEKLLQILINNNRIHLSEDYRKRVLQYGIYLSSEDTFRGVKKEKDILRKTLQVMKENRLSEKMALDSGFTLGWEELAAITEEIQDMLLRQDINTFLYDVGFTLKDNILVSSRKKDRSMEMLDAYCEEKGIHLFGQNGMELTSFAKNDEQEYMNACDALLQQLNEEQREDVFLPVMVDSATGVGIFIIGKRYYASDVGVQNDMQSSCGYGLIRFDGVDSETGMVFSLDFDTYDIPNMQEAKRWLKKSARIDAIAQYQDYNLNMPAECPPCFQTYFSESGISEEKDLEQSKEETRQLLERERQEEMRKKRRKYELMKKRNIEKSKEQHFYGDK